MCVRCRKIILEADNWRIFKKRLYHVFLAKQRNRTPYFCPCISDLQPEELKKNTLLSLILTLPRPRSLLLNEVFLITGSHNWSNSLNQELSRSLNIWGSHYLGNLCRPNVSSVFMMRWIPELRDHQGSLMWMLRCLSVQIFIGKARNAIEWHGFAGFHRIQIVVDMYAWGRITFAQFLSSVLSAFLCQVVGRPLVRPRRRTELQITVPALLFVRISGLSWLDERG